MHVGAVAAASSPELADAAAAPFELAWDEVGRAAPALHSHPRITLAAAVAASAASFWYYSLCAVADVECVESHRPESRSVNDRVTFNW